MLGVMVQGGTGAGRRVVKARAQWTCECRVFDRLWHKHGHKLGMPRPHPGDRYSCPDCGARRPS